MNEYATDKRDPELSAAWEQSLPEEVALGDMLLGVGMEDNANSESQDLQRLLPPLLASFLVHGLAVVALVSFSFQPGTQPVQPEPGVIQLRIRLPSPQADNPIAVAPVPEVVTDAIPQSSPSTPERTRAETLVDLPRVNISPAPTVTEANPERPSLRLLSPQDLRQTIDAIADRRSAGNALIDCTALQRQSELIDCGEDEDPRDFSVLERNPTYEFFTATDAPQQTRTQRTIGFMVSRADETEQQLLASGIGDIAVERFLQELRSTAADISATGNVQLERLKDQIYANDATYQQMQRVMNPR